MLHPQTHSKREEDNLKELELEYLTKSRASLKEAEANFSILLTAKVDKLVEETLTKTYHTQLSYLKPEEKERHRNIARAALIDKILLPLLARI